MEQIDSRNPIFTELLSEQPEDSLIRRMHPLYVSAADKLPGDDATVIVEASDIRHRGESDKPTSQWPHPAARPMPVLHTGPIHITDMKG